MCFFRIVDEILEYAYVLQEHLEVLILILNLPFYVHIWIDVSFKHILYFEHKEDSPSKTHLIVMYKTNFFILDSNYYFKLLSKFIDKYPLRNRKFINVCPPRDTSVR